jgi:hypothetical protein
MRITFLGGADEVGASSLLVEIGGSSTMKIWKHCWKVALYEYQKGLELLKPFICFLVFLSECAVYVECKQLCPYV